MKKQVYFIYVLFVIAGMLDATTCMAQTDCKNTYSRAEKLYEQGKVKEGIDQLENCLPEVKSKEEKFNYYHLLALSYLSYNNDVNKCDEYIYRMLKLKPEYARTTNSDPLDFRRRVNKFETKVKWSAGIGFGVNINSVKLIKSYSVYPSPQEYLPVTGYQFGFTSNYHLNKGYSLSFDLYLKNVGIHHAIDSSGNEKLNYRENQVQTEFITGIDKEFDFKKIFKPYLGIGPGLCIINSSDINIEQISLKKGAVRQSSKNALSERNMMQPVISFKGGLKFKLGEGFARIEVKYLHYFNQTVKSSKRMEDKDFIMENQYVNDDISFRLFMINFGYQIPLNYKIIKNKK